MRRILNVVCSVLTAGLFLAGSAAAQEASSAANAVESVNVAQKSGTIVVKLATKQPLSAVPNSFSVANPSRVAIDLPATKNAVGRASQAVNEGSLRSINFVETPEKMRVVFNLTQNVTYDMQIEGNLLLISLTPAAAVGPFQQKATAFTAERGGSAHAIRDINFRRGTEGEGRITVDLSDNSTGIDIKQQGSLLHVDFTKTSLPEHLRKKIDVTDFATPVTSVTTVQQGDNVRMTVSQKGLWEHNAYQTDTQFVLEVKPIIENPNKLVQGTRGGYQGEKLSLNFQNIDVRRLLQVIGEFTGMNMIVSDSVVGNITLVLKDVPWDQALDIVLRQKQLDMRKNGNVILVAPREEIAAREKLELEAKQQIGDLEPVKMESFQLNYHKAKSVFDFIKKDKDQTILSKRGSIIVDERTNKLFVTDVPSRLDDLRRLIGEIDIPMRQVLIEARIVEASDTFSRDMGVRLGWHQTSPWSISNGRNRAVVSGSLTDSGYHTGQSTTVPVFPTDSNFVNLPAKSGQSGQASLVLYNAAATKFVNLEVSALEADGRGKIVSSPRVMTADQVEAIIEQGVELPYLQATSSGATSVAFRKANLSLKVKPQITPDGKVTMTLDVNKDSPNTSIATAGAGIAIDTKHVKTEVLVENGGTVVIGGIYTQNVSEGSSRIPVLGEIPYLGWLFRNTTRSDSKTELLVFITPRIVSEGMTVR